MLKKIISIVPVAMLSVTLTTNVQAATITVQKGDTLWDLSRANNTSVENIQKLNNITTNLIHPGDVLTIAQQKQYTVKQGDTLWNIALDHQVTVSQIKEWNQLHTDSIHPGLKLLIFDGLKTSNTAVTEKSIVPAAHESKGTTTSVATPTTNNTTSKDRTPEATAPSTSNTASKHRTPEVNAPSTSNTASKHHTPEANAPSTSNTASKHHTPEANAPSTSNSASKEITVKASAYTASCEGCTGITATGINLKTNPNAKVISVDPAIIPLGSKVYVEGYGEAIAGDTGGAIKGNRIDVFVPSQQDAINFGVKQLKVTILN
ncbi:LysM peptidoglycan-binding and 3D domain-containing protein [Lysinibacillus xylanilyticus]|uniref:Peptidoglycan-binding protein n=1 Tax=Lysinibacillus xylanilyticus TaxID=582475 RepID=A0A2M9Q9S1_9BACI|nr:LysM peptidoglycan-binding and 3D domain-containing protein [Lysinibacillus xylanilyticus]PJO44814.1 peptidoglycan-binding protein [Lysinibacillus xylanilyticus]